MELPFGLPADWPQDCLKLSFPAPVDTRHQRARQFVGHKDVRAGTQRTRRRDRTLQALRPHVVTFDGHAARGFPLGGPINLAFDRTKKAKLHIVSGHEVH